MVQDIGTGRYNNAYKAKKAEDRDFVICCKKRDVWVRQAGDGLQFPTYKEVIERIPMLKGEETYLFEVDGISYFLFRTGAAGEMDIPALFENAGFEGYSWNGFRTLRDQVKDEGLFISVTASQLAAWYDNRRFCPHCGSSMKHSEKERMMQCPSCGLMEYPKISPAVIVAVTDEDKILLTKYAGRGHTSYALIAGFNEIGETIEETVHREVMEEVGLKVKNLRYYKSQPWSFTDTLLFGFFCELDGDPTIRLDEEELAVGEWCTREQVPNNDGISLTREMMSAFKNQK